ncbi:hypothetical protein F383_10089 [Gossypium arboreum]|uniref:Uncharacterized protein n=1 Tax=Gossypium arboreum TaxID=29729 RepID=A0A0B0PBV1_GOSAR|nr:hypothetical protein F383_10089 [Gossypium arboreum]
MGDFEAWLHSWNAHCWKHDVTSRRYLFTTVMVLQHAKPLNQLPLVGPLFSPPVNVSCCFQGCSESSNLSSFPPRHRRCQWNATI